MNRVRAFRLLAASLFLCSCFAASAVAQGNPFAPQPAPPLPAGMTGADVNDPRAKLKPGMYDAGEAASGMKLLKTMKKPDAFALSNDPNDPKVDKGVSIIAGDPTKVPPSMKLVLAGLAFANSDLAFQGNPSFRATFTG